MLVSYGRNGTKKPPLTRSLTAAVIPFCGAGVQLGTTDPGWLAVLRASLIHLLDEQGSPGVFVMIGKAQQDKRDHARPQKGSGRGGEPGPLMQSGAAPP